MRRPQMPPVVLLVLHVAMGAWLLLASARRMALDLNAGLPIDWVSIISAALGLVGLLLAVPAIDDAVPHHGDRDGPR